jgi:UDP-GlcNAc:undecaprenyl-phosphate GlcNAc-1-phosphate transferase
MINFIITVLLFNILFLIFHNKISEIINIYDLPNKVRKFHKKKTPITGGILIYSNLLIYVFFYFNDNDIVNFFLDNENKLFLFFLTCSLIFLVGILDDKRNLSPNLKLILLILIISPSIIFNNDLIISTVRLSFFENEFGLKNFSIFWTILCMLLFLNAVNMFDGINLQLTLYFFFQLIIIYLFASFDPFLFSLLIFLIVFFVLNFNSKSFLGDSGSLLVAYIFGCLFISLYNKSSINSDQIVLIMLIPGIELIRLFTSRLLQKKNPFKPDRNHLHHKLIKKNHFYMTTLKIQSLICFPNILSLLTGDVLKTLILTIVIYSYIIIKNN